MWRRLSTQLHHFAATAKISSTPRLLFRPSTISFSCSVIANYGTKDVKDNPVMLYMKGVPDLPRCRFSSLAVRVLKEYNVPLSARNILEDPELKNAVNAYK